MKLSSSHCLLCLYVYNCNILHHKAQRKKGKKFDEFYIQFVGTKLVIRHFLHIKIV